MKFRWRKFFRTAHKPNTGGYKRGRGQHLTVRTLSAALVVVTLLVPGAGVYNAAYAQEQTWKINVKNADLQEFVAQVAEITGNTIVVAPQLKGKVTVVSSANLDADGVNPVPFCVAHPRLHRRKKRQHHSRRAAGERQTESWRIRKHRNNSAR